tara:strand:+ start:4452 stop:4778 length:327 start_codon:yes stop_codon:yes gene_type:complete
MHTLKFFKPMQPTTGPTLPPIYAPKRDRFYSLTSVQPLNNISQASYPRTRARTTAKNSQKLASATAFLVLVISLSIGTLTSRQDLTNWNQCRQNNPTPSKCDSLLIPN